MCDFLNRDFSYNTYHYWDQGSNEAHVLPQQSRSPYTQDSSVCTDILTKVLTKDKHAKFTNAIGLVTPVRERDGIGWNWMKTAEVDLILDSRLFHLCSFE